MKQHETTDFEPSRESRDERCVKETPRAAEETPAEDTDDASETDEATAPDEAWCEANRNIRNGLLWCAGGILFSFLSYAIAVEGGRYFVATGAVIWGAVQAFRGFAARIGMQRRSGDRDGVLRTVGAALAAVAVIGTLTAASYRLAHANDVVCESAEQLYENDIPSVRFAVPAGYTALKRTDEPETETDYAYHVMNCYNEHSAIGLEMVGLNPADSIGSVDEVLDGLRGQDSTFFDAGLLRDPEVVELGGKRMLRRVGRRNEMPDLVSVTYDLIHDNAVLTFYYYYEGTAVDPAEEQRADALAASLELR